LEQDDARRLAAAINTLGRQFHSVAAPENICGSFSGSNCSNKAGSAPYVLEFSKEWTMESPSFQQVLELYGSLESLSTCRQNLSWAL
jgi:hypothetical protein